MQNLSQQKNAVRWEPKAKLRAGQQKLYELIKNTDKTVYSIQLPTGYGKSWCACIAYGVLRSKGSVDRMLIVVPTDQQRSQYIAGLADDLPQLGIPYLGIERCDNAAAWVIKKSHKNNSDIFVAGVQSIQSDPGYYADLMSKGRWLVVADEFHHYGDENSWGAAVKGLDYKVILGMSATPLRADKKPTIFGGCDFDVNVSIKDAYKEGAIKRICGRVAEYMISWSSLDDETPQNSLMSELAKEWPPSISEYELKQKIRYYDKYVSSIFNQVLIAWNEYESRWPGQNQILVFAMSCKHAEMVAALINSIAFPGFPTPFADWIGVGEGEYDSRTPEQNSEILSRFQNNQLPCLVQVNKAGEGFNNKRCSIGLFLDLVGDTPMKRQHIGRFMRVNSAAPGQSSLIFVSEDSPSRLLLESFEEEFGAPEQEEQEKREGTGEGGAERIVKVPDIYVIDAQYQSERLVWPYGSPEATIQAFLSQAPAEAKSAFDSLPADKAEEVLKNSVAKWLAEKQGMKPLSSEDRRKQIQEQVQRNVGVVVALYMKKRFGKSFPKSVKGDVYRLINSKAIKELGCRQSEMDEQDLRNKNEWLKELAEKIQKGDVPTWLDL